jgi:cyclomaltodextrinase
LKGFTVSDSSQPDWVPRWAREAVFYHIYPLGFLGAPERNDPTGEPVPRLAELRRWYDHIVNLGVTAIYFGPLFESVSHGYDTTDYFHVDRRLGDDDLFKQIVDELHGRGLRVIIDGVFNHTGREFFAFKDLRERGRESVYHDWYFINWGADSAYGDGFAYQCWEGHENLPRLNLANEKVRAYIFEVARKWLGEVGVDGWRLDVAHEIAPEFWWEFRHECKAVHPDCFLLGELLHGDYRVWVAPDLLDSGTDYQLHRSFWRALNDRNLYEMQAVMERAVHPEWGVYRDLTLVNFLGNHDVTRIHSVLRDPRHYYVALILLMTVPGIPMIYYGEEVGMGGRKEDGDANLRRPMPLPDGKWPDEKRHIYPQVARLAAIHKEHPALIYGDFTALSAADTTYSFLRRHEREMAVVVVSIDEEVVPLTLDVGRAGVPDGTTFRDALDPQGGPYPVQDGSLHVDGVPSCWGRVLYTG